VDDRYKRIADLFGLALPAPVEGEDEDTPRKLTGATAKESADLGAQSLTAGDYEKAIEHFRRAVEQSKDEDPALRIDLAGAYEYAEMAPQAMRQYLEALRVTSDAPEPHVGLSQLYKREGRWREAIAELEAALRADPENAFHYFKLAELHAEIGDRASALSAIQAAVVHAPDDPFYHYWMGDLLIAMKRPDEAVDALRAAVELSPGDDFLFLRTAVAFWNAGRPSEAVKAIRLASDLDPDQALYHGLLQRFLLAQNQEEEAALEAKRAQELDDYDAERLRRLLVEVGLTP
jgi:tetratricopeptide (TPR) repeat protein